MEKIDLLIMTDNCLETVGGEQESTKIIIEGVNRYFALGVLQPGIIERPAEGVTYFPLTTQTRLKHLVKKPFSFFKYIWDVRRIIKNHQPKVIHTQAQVSFFIIAILRMLRLIPKDIKFIHTERGLYIKYNNVIRGTFLFLMKQLDLLVTTTSFNMYYWKSAIQKKGLPVEFTVIENTAGELFETYDPKMDNRKEDGLVLGFAGRYCSWKNWPLAMEISEKLNRVLNDKLFVYMAVGCLDETSEKNTKRMFKRLKNTFGSRFKGAINIDLKTMNEFYYNIDVFVLTSNYNTESFGRTLVEAMSRKTVVLTTDSGGSVEVVGNKENVCMSSDEFINKILFFYNNKKVMNDEKNKNLKRVKKVYSLKNNRDKHIRLYMKHM